MIFEPNNLDNNFMDEEHSNFRVLGVGKRTEKQERNKAHRKEVAEHIRLEGRAIGKKVEKKLPKGVQKFIDRNEGGVLFHKANRFNPAMMSIRGAVISMLQMNLLGIASSFGLMKDSNSTHWDELLQKWWLIGGDKDKLNSNVDRGKDKKKKFLDFILKHQKKQGFDGEYSYASGDGKAMNTAGNVVGITAGALGIATPILAAGTATAPAAVYTGAAGTFLGGVTPIMKQFAKEKGASKEVLAQIPDAPAEPFPPAPTPENIQAAADAEDKIMGIPKTGFWIGVGLLTVLIVGGILISKKK